MERLLPPARDSISMTIVGIWPGQEPGEQSSTLSPPDHFTLLDVKKALAKVIFHVRRGVYGF